jgi:hypothetical protein
MGLFNKSEKGSVDPTIPEITHKVPLVPFKVLRAGLPFFRDEACADEVLEARLAVIQALDPDDEVQELDLVPTTKTYREGDYVTLAFDNKKLWEDCYYRDPESGEVVKAWRIHVNFIGEVISPEALAQDKDRVADLERRVREKIEEIARRRREEPESGERVN